MFLLTTSSFIHIGDTSKVSPKHWRETGEHTSTISTLKKGLSGAKEAVFRCRRATSFDVLSPALTEEDNSFFA